MRLRVVWLYVQLLLGDTLYHTMLSWWYVFRWLRQRWRDAREMAESKDW